MSPMNGVVFTQMVRSGRTPFRDDLPIIMMTSHADAAHVQRAREAGVNGFIAKPLSVGMVIKQIGRTLSASAATRAA